MNDIFEVCRHSKTADHLRNVHFSIRIYIARSFSPEKPNIFGKFSHRFSFSVRARYLTIPEQKGTIRFYTQTRQRSLFRCFYGLFSYEETSKVGSAYWPNIRYVDSREIRFQRQESQRLLIFFFSRNILMIRVFVRVFFNKNYKIYERKILFF